MNMFDSSFLCLDIGTAGCRGVAHRVREGRLEKSAVFCADGYDTVFAIKNVIDELEREIGAHFDRAFVTGNFGTPHFEMSRQNTPWDGEHKITVADIKAQIASIDAPDGMYAMHIVPLRYDTPTARDMEMPAEHTDRQLVSVFGALFYPHAALRVVDNAMRRAHIRPHSFFDVALVHGIPASAAGETVLIIDLGASGTTAAIWAPRGPMFIKKIPNGGTEITRKISQNLNLDFDQAERIKRAVATLVPQETDRFTPADTMYDFSRADVNDIVLPEYVDIIAALKSVCADAIAKYRPTRIILAGGGGDIPGAVGFVENAFGLPVSAGGVDGNVRALADYIWAGQAAHRRAYMMRRIQMHRIGARIKSLFRRRRRVRARFIPIMPSTLCFDMRRPETYAMFRAGGISVIHVDIMDGLYVDKIAGGLPMLRMIRAATNAHLHVHLMTESPAAWTSDVVAAGADTVILSPQTAGIRSAIKIAHAAKKRVGIALNPENSLASVKEFLRDVDEIMVMAVAPGGAGRPFDDGALRKIASLRATRQKYDLKFVISVDGGINPETAARCWAAGADMLVSGSYLKKAPDFPLAVQSLLKR